jgi:antitoxin YefM
MIVVSSREFRQNQKHYLDLIDKNESVVIQRGKDKAYKITPVNQKDSLMSEEEFAEKINRSIKQALEGNSTILTKEQQSKLLGL